jgi:AbrB family looped-hinge helix DNA binding protein
MNFNTITRPNSKGQIVIPKRFRDELNIDETVSLSVVLSGGGVFISPLEKTVISKNNRAMILNILKKTAGTWAKDDKMESEKKRRKIELASTTKNRSAKW